jgi:hypothetical protein
VSYQENGTRQPGKIYNLDCFFWTGNFRDLFFIKKNRGNVMEKMKKVNKKGELTTQQLVTLIILIMSFVIILFLLFRLNLGEETKKEICHNSVVLLSKKEGFFSALDCETSYICFTGGRECESFNADYKTEFSLNEENSEQKIIEGIEKEIDDCWWMFGEGDIDYTGALDYLGYRCAICSSIKFDERIQEKFPEINFNGIILSTQERYLIITGINKEVGEENFIEPIIVKADEINSMNPKCDEFVTKA